MTCKALIAAAALVFAGATPAQQPGQAPPADAALKLQHIGQRENGLITFVDATTFGKSGDDGFLWTYEPRADGGALLTRIVVDCKGLRFTQDWIVERDKTGQVKAQGPGLGRQETVSQIDWALRRAACSGQKLAVGPTLTQQQAMGYLPTGAFIRKAPKPEWSLPAAFRLEAAGWDEEGFVYELIDLDSIKRSGTQAEAWILSVETAQDTAFVTRTTFNCTARSRRSEFRYQLDADGRIAGSNAVIGTGYASSEGELDEAVFGRVCNDKPARARVFTSLKAGIDASTVKLAPIATITPMPRAGGAGGPATAPSAAGVGPSDVATMSHAWKVREIEDSRATAWTTADNAGMKLFYLTARYTGQRPGKGMTPAHWGAMVTYELHCKDGTALEISVRYFDLAGKMPTRRWASARPRCRPASRRASISSWSTRRTE